MYEWRGRRWAGYLIYGLARPSHNTYNNMVINNPTIQPVNGVIGGATRPLRFTTSLILAVRVIHNHRRQYNPFFFSRENHYCNHVRVVDDRRAINICIYSVFYSYRMRNNDDNNGLPEIPMKNDVPVCVIIGIGTTEIDRVGAKMVRAVTESIIIYKGGNYSDVPWHDLMHQ